MSKVELTLNERKHDLWLKDDVQYAIILMYSISDFEAKPRFITGGPYKSETVEKKITDMLNSAEQGRFVCHNSQFINPNCVKNIKICKWKDRDERDYTEGQFYE